MDIESYKTRRTCDTMIGGRMVIVVWIFISVKCEESSVTESTTGKFRVACVIRPLQVHAGSRVCKCRVLCRI